MTIDTLNTGRLEDGAPADVVSTQSAVAATAPGAVILVRHGEPALSRKIKLDSAGYRRWWGAYEIGGLLEGQTPPEKLKASARGAHAIFCSTRLRSIETARAVAGERAVVEDPLFIEAPLPPPNFPSFLKFSPRTWGVIARLWWWIFNHHEGQETRDEAKVRARLAAESLAGMAQGGRDVMVLAHGFFNGMVGMELKRLGWKLTSDEGFQYWCARRFEKR